MSKFTRRVEKVYEGVLYSFNCGFNRDSLTFEFSDEAMHDAAVQRAKRDHEIKYNSTPYNFALAIMDVIREDQALGAVPHEIESFSDVHDYVDGNAYLWEIIPDATERVGLCNEVSEHLDRLIAEALEEVHS